MYFAEHYDLSDRMKKLPLLAHVSTTGNQVPNIGEVIADLLYALRLLLMQWTAPTTGIAMCQNAVAVEGRRESAYG